MLGEILDDLLISASTGRCITATRHFPARPPVPAPFPASLDPRIAETLRSRGIEQLFSHQARVWELLEAGRHVVVVTPTASGKTLCYNLPALQSLIERPEARVLYLFPTKALAQDQLAELEAIAKSLPEMRMFTYDGDTPQDARRAVRARANLVLTNPDMLHSGVLPHHTKWASLFQNLRYVVIDELHAYRGVFGSHLANVLRRLKRICAHYGSTPQFIMASATIANPGELASSLTGEPVEEVAESGAPAGEKTFVCYNPPVVNPELGIRAPYLGEAAKLATRLLRAEVPTIVFAQSRLSTEVLLASIKQGVADRATGDAGIVRGYRGGYLPNRRRAVERELARLSAWCRRTRSSSAWTSAISTPRCWPDIPAPSPPSGSRPVAPGVAPVTRRRSWSRPARRSISSWSLIPTISSGRRPSTPGSTPTIRSSS
jgi:DEAD/DEAH box helicase domain-containing protein